MPNNNKPAFIRQESWRYKRVKPAWRRARGVTSKMRKEEAGWPAKVKAGYGTAAATRGLHPRVLQERLIHRLSELEGLCDRARDLPRHLPTHVHAQSHGPHQHLRGVHRERELREAPRGRTPATV